jgi:hypothetical protein
LIGSATRRGCVEARKEFVEVKTPFIQAMKLELEGLTLYEYYKLFSGEFGIDVALIIVIVLE